MSFDWERISIYCKRVFCTTFWDKQHTKTFFYGRIPAKQNNLQWKIQKQPPRLFSKYLFSFWSTFFWSFPGNFTSSVHRTDTNSPSRDCPNRYYFSRSYVYLSTEQIPFFQEHFFGYQIDTDFPRALFLATEQIQTFQEHLLLPRR